MSTEKIHALMKAAEADAKLADTLKHAGGLDQLVQIGAQRGYLFTQDELKAYFESLPSEALDEQELESVAGGTAHVAISLGDGSARSPLAFELKNVYVTSYSISGSSD